MDLITDPALLHRYGAAKRYACYPGDEHFSTLMRATARDTGVEAYIDRLAKRHQGGPVPTLSLYVRGPDGGIAGQEGLYLECLSREIDLLAPLLRPERPVTSLHCRTDARFGDHLLHMVRDTFALALSGHYALETTAHDLSPDRIAQLRAHGFNHLRIDTRSGPAADLADIVRQACDVGFKSVDILRRVDNENAAQLLSALARDTAARPDRLILSTQAFLAEPSRAKLELLRTAAAALAATGYVYLGLDHFVRGDDELMLARRRGTLNYGLHGYFNGADCDTLGLGVAAIGDLRSFYSRNETALADYRAALDRGRLPVRCGLVLGADDLVRRGVIQALICHLEVPFESIDAAYLIDFKRYFAPELAQLEAFARAGVIELGDEWITVTPRGRLLLPAVCGVFDRHSQGPRL